MKDRCPFCKKDIDYSLIQSSPHPDADGCCYECLPEDMQKLYDAWCESSFPAKKLDNSTTENCDSSMMIHVDLSSLIGPNFEPREAVIFKRDDSGT